MRPLNGQVGRNVGVDLHGDPLVLRCLRLGPQDRIDELVAAVDPHGVGIGQVRQLFEIFLQIGILSGFQQMPDVDLLVFLLVPEPPEIPVKDGDLVVMLHLKRILLRQPCLLNGGFPQMHHFHGDGEENDHFNQEQKINGDGNIRIKLRSHEKSPEQPSDDEKEPVKYCAQGGLARGDAHGLARELERHNIIDREGGENDGLRDELLRRPEVCDDLDALTHIIYHISCHYLAELHGNQQIRAIQKAQIALVIDAKTPEQQHGHGVGENVAGREGLRLQRIAKPHRQAVVQQTLHKAGAKKERQPAHTAQNDPKRLPVALKQQGQRKAEQGGFNGVFYG